MAALPLGEAKSIGDLLKEARRISQGWKKDFREREEIWFRGQSQQRIPLLPTLYRETNAGFNYDEPTLVNRFEALGTPYVVTRPTTEWEWYFLARHHSLPSRLLDWTDSLLGAALFALFPYLPENRLEQDNLSITEPDDCSFDDTCPTVWLMDAGTLNVVSGREDRLVVPGGPKSDPYLPDNLKPELLAPTNEFPIAILPPRANSRIVAQQGVFTLHGWSKISIDELAANDPRLRLGAIRLDRNRTAHMIDELHRAGVTRLSLFPDLDHVAEHVCWVCQSSLE